VIGTLATAATSVALRMGHDMAIMAI